MEDQRTGRHSTLSGISCQRGWVEMGSYTLSIFHHLISLQMMTTTFVPKYPLLSSSMERKLPPSPPPRVCAGGGGGERGVEECVG